MKKLFYFLLALPLVMSACTENGNEPEPVPPTPNDPVLTLTSNAEMEFTAQGGNGIITYTLVNEVEGVELEAACEAGWITNLTVGDNIVFVVPANEGEAREATIAVTYGETQSFNVAVKQAAKSEQPDNTPSFTLTSNEVMEFGQDAAMGTITFEIKNPVNGVNVTAKANVDWISQITPQEDKIVFAVAANTGDAREGKITAEYGMLKFSVTVKQAQYVAPKPVINLNPATVEVAAEGGAQSVAYTIDNAVEGVELAATCEAAWIEGLTVSAEAITFTVAESAEAGLRSAVIALTYGEVTAEIIVNQTPAGADPDTVYKRYGLVWLKASTRSANQWDIIICEKDEYNVGDIFTRISVQLPEDNAMYITDGTYSVANGGILLNSSLLNGYSTYAYNGVAEDIADATIEVVNDLDAKTSVIKGSFTVGNILYSLEYSGAVDGFVYEKLGDDGITAWDEFCIYSQWDDFKYIVAKSSGVTFDIYLVKLGGKKSDPLATGRYPVGDWERPTTRDYCDNSSTKINGTLLVSGEFVVAEDPAGYKFTFDVIDANGTNWKGTYVGPIEY